MFKLIWFLLLFFVASIPVHCAIVMRGSNESLISAVYIDGELLRIDIAESENSPSGMLVYRGNSAGSLVIVDLYESSYYEITSTEMLAIKEQVARAVDIIKALIRDIPEEDREKAVPLIRGLIPPEYSGLLAMIDVEKRVVHEERNVRLGEWLCDKYSVYENSNKVTEAWFVSFEQLGVEKDDLKVLKDFDSFLEIPAPGMVPGFLISEVGYENGIPVRIVDLDDDGKAVPTLQIEKFSLEEVDRSVFEVPEGFKKQELSL